MLGTVTYVRYPKLCEDRLGDIHTVGSPNVPCEVSHCAYSVLCPTP